MFSQRTHFMLALATALICLIPLAAQGVEPYSQDFEGLTHTDPSALADDGWWVYGNVFTAGGDYLYGYGPYPAPNDGFAFCQIDVGEGGDEQGEQQLVVFSDYNNGDHAGGNIIESNVFQEQTIGPENIGTVWNFDFQAKRGNLEGDSTAMAFIKTLDPSSGWALTNFITVEMTTIPETWADYSISIDIDETLDGQVLQFGFLNNASFYEGSAIFYDNLNFAEVDLSTAPDSGVFMGVTMGQNYPNPFNPRTRIDFALDNPQNVEIAVYDLAGRKVATLERGILPAGQHHVSWDGSNDRGLPVATGQYRYVLKTASGQVSRSMILLK